MDKKKIKPKKKTVKISCCKAFADSLLGGQLQIEDEKLYVQDGEYEVYYCPFCGFKLLYE